MCYLIEVIKYNGILSCNKSVYKRDYYGRQHIAHLEFLAEGKVNTHADVI